MLLDPRPERKRRRDEYFRRLEDTASSQRDVDAQEAWVERGVIEVRQAESAAGAGLAAGAAISRSAVSGRSGIMNMSMNTPFTYSTGFLLSGR